MDKRNLIAIILVALFFGLARLNGFDISTVSKGDFGKRRTSTFESNDNKTPAQIFLDELKLDRRKEDASKGSGANEIDRALNF